MTGVSLIRSFVPLKFSGFCSNSSLGSEMFQIIFITGIIAWKGMGLSALQRDKWEGACVKLSGLLYATKWGFLLFSLLFRASGTVYTAMDVATGQEVSATRITQHGFWVVS